MNNDYLEQQIKQIDEQIEEARLLLDDPELAEMAELEIERLEQQKAKTRSSSICCNSND
jgi:hypothetical protein